jgi:5'(3')-deoxyribonucleotidase
MNIAIDIDGVLRDQTTALRKRYLKEFPEHADLVKPITAWGIHEFYPIGKEIYKLWFGPWAQDCFEFAQKFDGAGEMMEAVKMQGHKAYLLTSQVIRTEAFTVAWVDQHKIPHDGILFCHEKGLTRFDVLLDDGEHNLEAVSKVGTRAIAFDQPWNQGWQGERVVGTIPEKYAQFLSLIQPLKVAA